MYLAESIYDSIQKITFSGMLDDSACKSINTHLPFVSIKTDALPKSSELTVIDFMFDERNPAIYDEEILLKIKNKTKRSLLICGSPTIPNNLPVDSVVGHLLEDDQDKIPAVYGGLKYAPVPTGLSHGAIDNNDSVDLNSILIAFGNWHNAIAFEKTLGGLAELNFSGNITVLLPPGLNSYIPKLSKIVEGLKVEFLSNVPSVLELISKHELVIGGYGNLTYEALAGGRPFIIIGVKDFMVDYGKRLEDLGCVKCAGHVERLSTFDIGHTILNYKYEERIRHAKNGTELIDGNGFQRISDLIQKEFKIAFSL
jgi:spore coat polysaccharide biosynthesis predicted glycosyltransferase SpsG